MNRALRFTLSALLLFAGCGQCGGQPQTPSLLCNYPFQVGPDGTAGQCDLGSVCLPASMAQCGSNFCCHAFCSVDGCPNQSACLTLTPDQFPDGGPPGCGCADGGPCVCASADGGADGGLCLRPSCLEVCGDPS
ncbi:MAG: hypothetical protein ACYCWW_09090 [Deltaproteobacteria bacterium]